MANQIIIDIGAVANDGTGDPLRTAFNYVNNNFSNIWATGVANSNILFSGNKILTTNTNGNLVLAPNGIGKVQANVDIVPNANNTLSLGSLTNKWNTVYAQNLSVSGNTSFGDLTIDGNLTVNGTTTSINTTVVDIEDKNITLAYGSANATQANGAGITIAGANAQITYTSANDSWNLNRILNISGQVNATGNITTTAEIIANGNVTAGGPIVSSGNITAGGNISTTKYISGNLIAPGGNGQVLYNKNGVVGASPTNFNYDQTTETLYVTTGSFLGESNTGANALYAGIEEFTFLGSDIMAQFAGNVASYSQINFQNTSNSAVASGDYIITADNGTDSTHFIDLGITSSTWDGTQPNSLGNRLGPNDGYLYVQDGDMVIGTSNGTIETWKFSQDGTLTVPGDIATDAADLTVSVGLSDWIFDETGVLTAPGEIETVGNISAGYFIGNGSQLTGLPASYANANVVAYGQAGWAGNIIPSGNAVYSLGNATNQWNDLYISNATIYMNNVPISLTTGNVLTVNGQAVVTTNANGNANIGNLAISGATIEIASGASETLINISPDAEGWAYLQLPTNATANSANTRLHNDAGNVEIGTGDFSTGSSSYEWVFTNTGNLTLPNNGSIIVDGDGVIGPVSDDMVISWDNEELILRSVAGSIELQADNDVRVQSGYSVGAGDYQYKWSFSNNNELINITGDSAIVTEAGNLAISGGRDGYSSGNVTVRAVDVGVAVQNWTFENSGQITLPGGTGYISSAANTISIYSNEAETNGMLFYDNGSGDTGAEIYAANNFAIFADNDGSGNTWRFYGNATMSAPGNITTTGNISVGNILAQNIRTINGNVYIGQGAGLTNQGLYGIAVGRFAGGTDQGAAGLAIGQLAGSDTQGTQAIALGLYAGANTQSANAIAIGTYAGQTTQGASAIAIGRQAGIDNQGAFAVAVGWLAGNTSQGGYSVSVGPNAGSNTQGQNSVAIGVSAAREAQGNAAIAIGQGSGTISQGAQGIAIGDQAGQQSQAANAIAIGTYAGYESAGISSISIGTGAGYYIANNAIVINATGANLDGNTANTFTVAPVRNDVANVGQVMFYNTTSKEVTYGNTISIAGNATFGNINTAGTANSANILMTSGYVNTSAGVALNLVPLGSAGTRVWSKLVPNANVAFSLGSSTEYWANGYIGNLIGTTGNFTGNVTAANFSGNISITGNVTGTSANVTLVAGAYSAVFDNTGVATFPGDLKGDILISTNSSGSEGGEIQLSLPTAGNTTLSGTNIIIDSYSDRIRFFEGGGNARGMYIDLANSPDGQVNAAIGYRDVPQIALGANVTANLTNAGKHFYSTTAGNLAVLIPTNANVAFPTGATLTLVVNAAGNVLVNADTGVLLYMAGSSTTGNRTVGAYGLASVMKVATDTWVISGTGVY